MSTTNGEGARLTVRDFQERKDRGEKLVVVTAYDSLFGKLVDESGVDAVLVGDSLGNLLAGYDSTLPVTLDQMVYHARSTRAGVKRAMLIVDMPFLTYQVSPQRALLNCGRVMAEAGADAVKVEGASETVLAAVRAATEAGIPVMGHLGFTPQSVNALGGTRVQARDAASAKRIVEDAKRLEDAGVFSIGAGAPARESRSARDGRRSRADDRHWRRGAVQRTGARAPRSAGSQRGLQPEVSQALRSDGGGGARSDHALRRRSAFRDLSGRRPQLLGPGGKRADH